MTFSAWASANPDKAAILISAFLAAVIGTTGELIAKHVDGEKNPRIFQLGKAMQNFGIAIPKFVERMLGVVQGTKPSEEPKPPSENTKTLILGAFVLITASSAAACGHGAKACLVVDASKALCDGGVRYLAKDGTPETITLDELEAVHKAKARARAVGSSTAMVPQ